MFQGIYILYYHCWLDREVSFYYQAVNYVVYVSTIWYMFQLDGICFNQMLYVSTRCYMFQLQYMVYVSTRWYTFQLDGICFNQMVYVSTRWYTFQLYDIIKFTFLRFLFFSLKQITKISVRSNKRTRPKRDYYSTKETVLVRSSIVLHNCCVLKYHSLFCFYPSRYILLTCDWLMTLRGFFIKGEKKTFP